MTVVLLLASTPQIDAYFSACPAPAQAFRSPRSGGWIVAPAEGTVRVAGDGKLELSHCYFENHEVRVTRLVAEGLTSLEVKVGDVVKPGQRLGRGKQVALRFGDQPVETFLRAHPALFVPQKEKVLVVVDVEGHRAVRFELGRRTHEWEVGRGQAAGPKEQRGDLRTPRGLYFVVDRSRGPFTGAFSEYYGGSWVKVNYPNAFDATRGREAGLISATQQAEISRSWNRRALTPQGTKLGGGIGFHGWNGPWTGDESGYGLSWGCVVLHPEEARGFLELTPVGAAVVML